jgi:hypothetical protein
MDAKNANNTKDQRGALDLLLEAASRKNPSLGCYLALAPWHKRTIAVESAIKKEAGKVKWR